MNTIPSKITDVLNRFSGMSSGEHRMALMVYSRESGAVAPAEGEEFTCSSERIDEGCTDSVGVFIRDAGDAVRLRVRLGRNTQTLTRALGHLLCLGLDGEPLEALLGLPDDISSRLVGLPADSYNAKKLRYMQDRIAETAREVMFARESVLALA